MIQFKYPPRVAICLLQPTSQPSTLDLPLPPNLQRNRYRYTLASINRDIELENWIKLYFSQYAAMAGLRQEVPLFLFLFGLRANRKLQLFNGPRDGDAAPYSEEALDSDIDLYTICDTENDIRDCVQKVYGMYSRIRTCLTVKPSGKISLHVAWTRSVSFRMDISTSTRRPGLKGTRKWRFESA
jgi:hypothetical protein